MDQRPLVVLLGDSVLMDSVAACLAVRQVMVILRIDGSDTAIAHCLRTLEPALIILELDNPESPSIPSFLREQSNTLLLGLDLDCSRVIVLNSQQHATRTMKDLYQVVRAEVGQGARELKGGGLSESLEIGMPHQP